MNTGDRVKLLEGGYTGTIMCPRGYEHSDLDVMYSVRMDFGKTVRVPSKEMIRIP
jgi:hypothetical protein